MPAGRKPGDPIERFLSKIEPCPTTGCWLWVAATKGQYGAIGNGKHSQTMTAHRMAWILFKGRIPDDKHVLHHCDVPLCVNPDHLWLGTRKDNMQDKVQKGRHSAGDRKGEKNHMAVLTWAQVEEIRSSHERGVALAKRFGVSNSTICAVRKGRRWHVH